MKTRSSGPILVLFARPPRRGEVKTRIAEVIGDEKTLELYVALLRDSIEILRRVSARGIRLAIAWAEPPESLPREIADALAGVEILQQEGQDLGQRMSNCLAELLARGHDRVVIMGADSPSLPPEHVERAFDQLRGHDLVIGPSTDGGYYLIGARAVVPEIFRGIAWGTDRVLPETLRILKIFGLPRVLLPECADVDTVEDIRGLNASLADRSTADPTARHTRAVIGALRL